VLFSNNLYRLSSPEVSFEICAVNDRVSSKAAIKGIGFGFIVTIWTIKIK
jgi:hypothetical protein